MRKEKKKGDGSVDESGSNVITDQGVSVLV